MVLYTIIPVEQVLEGFEEWEPELREVSSGSLTLVVEPGRDGSARIVRLISPDPTLYLNPLYQPGSILRLPSVVPPF